MGTLGTHLHFYISFCSSRLGRRIFVSQNQSCTDCFHKYVVAQVRKIGGLVLTITALNLKILITLMTYLSLSILRDNNSKILLLKSLSLNTLQFLYFATNCSDNASNVMLISILYIYIHTIKILYFSGRGRQLCQIPENMSQREIHKEIFRAPIRNSQFLGKDLW